MQAIASLIVLCGWLAGAALASGFWSTLAAVFFPPWALYLVVERGLRMMGWL